MVINMKKSKIIILVIICSIVISIIIATCLFASNHSIDFVFGQNTIEEQNLVVDSGRNYTDYTYMDKVKISHFRTEGEYYDMLYLKTGEDWIEKHCVLNDKFQSVAWYDDVLFIETENIYYIFDINEYNPLQDIDLKKGEIPKYTMKKTSYQELIKDYPNYHEFDIMEFYK